MKKSSPRKRTQARELALQCLYQIDLKGDWDHEDLERVVNWSRIPDESKEFALELVRECWSHRDEIDREIRAAAEHWDLERMASIDRSILRMAIYELLHRVDIPPKVSINEAIELGKKFSTKNSGGFINGILDRIRKDRSSRPSEPSQEQEGGDS